ncbi:hypothetical protein LJC12_00795 [Odoribacter sp. OttesenSCG-928-J03]|nr:hypothetical protein [Odoribacter sp. OttesenSCG-928-J03]MDL2283224.1 hypothetical protein [Odoribacter sp. OttesenSCG-928-G04]MDL2331357.1 hypothetical protein [Odoribacter sp. OttesenSCG-928-A06]
MKKIIISAILCMGVVFSTLAQEKQEEAANPLVNKRGIALLPQAGDYAIGIDATPFFEYFGNFFHNGGGKNFAPTFSGKDYTLYGKYFLTDNRAIRAKLRINITQDKFKQTVQDDEAVLVDPTNSAATTVDVEKYNSSDFSLTAGYEFRRGRGRLQGFYGGEFTIGAGGGKYAYDYGNPITAANPAPSFEDFDWGSPAQGYRLTEIKYGPTFQFGLGAFAGVEYFFAPQMSIGGELSLGFDYFIKGQREMKSEGYLDGEVHTYKSRSRRYNSTETDFNVGLKTRTEGAIFIMFYF